MSRDTLVGTTLAGYSIKDMVGEGGTSAVYRADHPQHGVVALKVLREKLRQDRTAVARFTREAKFGTRVQHPNVVRTIETGESGPGLHYLAIEWAAGEILERYAKRNAPLPRDEVARIVTQIGDAVQAAHAAGIVHRDLKPDNVMYDPESHQVKLLDFGIAAATDTAADRASDAGRLFRRDAHVRRSGSTERRTCNSRRRSVQPGNHCLLSPDRLSTVSRQDSARDVHATVVATAYPAQPGTAESSIRATG